mmetsp:Transcript_6045/g.18638  ORF Transcript_6045/g.18638 Transcript_6045/m.18638 type:complete len:237 (-) Transcript_6045:54-764(-)
MACRSGQESRSAWKSSVLKSATPTQRKNKRTESGRAEWMREWSMRFIPSEYLLSLKTRKIRMSLTERSTRRGCRLPARKCRERSTKKGSTARRSRTFRGAQKKPSLVWSPKALQTRKRRTYSAVKISVVPISTTSQPTKSARLGTVSNTKLAMEMAVVASTRCESTRAPRLESGSSSSWCRRWRQVLASCCARRSSAAASDPAAAGSPPLPGRGESKTLPLERPRDRQAAAIGKAL